MSMEKRGVIDGEGEAPKPQEKEAAANETCSKPKCCGQQACGTDPMSKMAEAVADKSAK